jgi:hypothetical protein
MFFPPWLNSPCGLVPTHFGGFTITLTQPSVGLFWTSDQPFAETSTSTMHNTHKRETSMPSVGFQPTIPGSERPQTHALDRAANGTGFIIILRFNLFNCFTVHFNSLCVMVQLMHLFVIKH